MCNQVCRIEYLKLISYLSGQRCRELRTYNPADLEFNDLPHAFFAQDERFLVISMALVPLCGRDCLADLWVQPGECHRPAL